jgi:serpin B
MKKNIVLSTFCIIALFMTTCKTGSKTTVEEPVIEDTKSETLTRKQIEKPNPQIAGTVAEYEKNRIEDRFRKPNDMPIKLTDFSLDMFKRLSNKEEGKSLAYSPVSLHLAFGMVYTGAEQKTADEISTAIGFDREMPVFFRYFGDYHSYLKNLSNDTAIDFNLANRVFLENNFKILDGFNKNVTKYFDGAFEQMDFVKKPKESEQYINSWVEEMTKTRIKNLLPQGTIDPITRMILVNAIYIKSEWKFPFEENRTREDKFYVLETATKKREFMSQKRDGIKYTEINRKQVIELEYNSPELSLIIILPTKSTADNIGDAIPSKEEYFKIISTMKHREVYMEIPKFKTESTYNLKETLMDAGIESAFNNADFSGITGGRDLEISQVIQKVFFEIDEKGSEAAAATAVVMRLTSSGPDTRPPDFVRFIANHPFIYILKENTYHTPLFIGQFTGE